MRIARRSLLVIVAAIIATAGLTLLWITLPPATALSASPAPMPEPLAPTVEFSATLRLTPDRARVEVGQAIVGEVAAWPQLRFDGVVRTIDARIDPASRAATVRADFAESTRRNAVHASDSPESAAHEIALWFGEV